MPAPMLITYRGGYTATLTQWCKVMRMDTMKLSHLYKCGSQQQIDELLDKYAAKDRIRCNSTTRPTTPWHIRLTRLLAHNPQQPVKD
jgi:hypothetical protein